MRITLEIDSATVAEAHAFIFAYQRTRELDSGLPRLQDEPYVRILGKGWGVTTPPISKARAVAMLRDFESSVPEFTEEPS